MCRLALKTAIEPFSPYEVLTAMEAMQEGYDGSGLGLLLRGLHLRITNTTPGTPFFPGLPTARQLGSVNSIMEQRGYELKYDHEFETHPAMVEAKDRYRYFRGRIKCTRLLNTRAWRR